MNRTLPPAEQSSLFVEALEPRIAPAGLLNESKFTSVIVGGALLLDASDPNGFQGLSTGFGANSGSYLLYVTAGKALVYTSDINGDGQLDLNEITGISAGVDAQGRSLDLLAFVNINGDIVTNLLPGTGVSALTDSDNNPNNGRDGRILLDNGIHSITLRALAASDIDITIPGNLLQNRLAPTNRSLFGNIYTGGDFGAPGAGLIIGQGPGTPQIGDIMTGTAASNQHFRFTISGGVDLQNTLLPFKPQSGEHGADIIGVKATLASDVFDVGTMATGDGGLNARGGNLSEIVLHGDRGGYKLIAGNGGQGATGAMGGSIINFIDLSSVTSEVILHSGDGGVGLLGAGGAAGTVTLGTANIAANLRILLGNGGNGFTAGGNGATQLAGIFTPAEGGVPVGGLVLGTYHNPGDIGNTHTTGTDGAGQFTYQPTVVDFDGDGIGDAVYTSINPDQIVVVFGAYEVGADGKPILDDAGHRIPTGTFFDNFSTLPSETVYLNAPGLSAGTVSIGDINGDGRPDIIAASGAVDSAAGIYVFINQTHDNVHNPLGGRLFMGNPLGDHPFSSAFQTPLPALGTSATTVFALATGDFNGDGLVDVGVISRLGAGPANTRVLTVLLGDVVRDPNINPAIADNRVFDSVTGKPAGSGYFFANTSTSPRSFGQLLEVDVPRGSYILKATGLVADSGATDVLTLGVRGDRNINSYYVDVDPFFQLSSLVSGPSFGLGQVDTNRAAQTSLQEFTLQDYSLQDIDGDGALDVVALSTQPAYFLGTFQGGLPGGPGSVTPDLINASFNFRNVVTNGADNSGIFLGGTGTLTSIVAVDQNSDGTQDGLFADIALLRVPDTGSARIQEYSLQSSVDPAGPPGGIRNGPEAGASGRPGFADAVQGRTFALSNISDDSAVLGGLSPYYSSVSDAFTGYGVLDPNSIRAFDDNVEFFANDFTGGISASASFIRPETDNGVRITGGDGGNAIAGVAGSGGSVGTGVLTAAPNGGIIGNIQLISPSYAAYNGEFILTGGHGGNGFTGGGAGGDITSVTSRIKNTANVVVELSAGDGGIGISGDGGRGGDLTQFSVQFGDFFTAGNGGTGLRGGRGGSILGNGMGFFDTQDLNVTALAGQGAVGALGGGAGGSISSFLAQYDDLNGLIGGSLLYVSGNGGSAAAGDGGTGGGILNSSPDNFSNLLAGPLALQTGIGGNGLTGGAGGAITNFVNQSTALLATPFTLNIVTGGGGIGVTSHGGVGGTITNFRANALGLDPLISGVTGLNTGIVRILAGNGGASFGAEGGNGGAITGSVSQAQSAPIVAAAGAGGAGVVLGGTGGSVTNLTLNAAAQTLGKMLVIAGAGGDAVGVQRGDVIIPDDPNTGDLAHAVLAFGGASGVGGDGGNISNLTQPVSVQTAVDLIAGNGGSTINYGTTLSPTSNVGRGGSVTNVNLAGTVGVSVRDPNSGINPPIRSYTDLNNDGIEDTTIAQFIQDNLGGTFDASGLFFATNPGFLLDNSTGNVGIVAGAAGRVKAVDGVLQPPRDGVNGSVQNVSAASIMSIVAGSVDRVSPVQTLSGIAARNIDGVLGADKSLPTSPTGGDPNNIVEYFNQNAGASSLQPGQLAISLDVPPTYNNGTVVVSNLQPGFRLIDGAIYAQNIIQPATPPLIQGPRVFVFSQG